MSGKALLSHVSMRVKTGVLLLGALLAAAALAALPASAGATTLSTSTCHLAGPYQHVIYIQYDNVHLTRDNPNVPSDLEQTPALKNFLQGQGALLNNHHPPLISHTSGDIVDLAHGPLPRPQRHRRRQQLPPLKKTIRLR